VGYFVGMMELMMMAMQAFLLLVLGFATSGSLA
jgi:hypothetical protein